MSALGAYLRAACGQPWRAGVYDCCTLPGDWALSWGRGDPMAEWRGQYQSDAQAVRLIHEAGGLLELWRRGLSAIGITTVGDPNPGDVGIVPALIETGQLDHVGAIWTGERWAMRAPSGIFFAPNTPVCVWGPRG